MKLQNPLKEGKRLFLLAFPDTTGGFPCGGSNIDPPCYIEAQMQNGIAAPLQEGLSLIFSHHDGRESKGFTVLFGGECIPSGEGYTVVEAFSAKKALVDYYNGQSVEWRYGGFVEKADGKTYLPPGWYRKTPQGFFKSPQ